MDEMVQEVHRSGAGFCTVEKTRRCSARSFFGLATINGVLSLSRSGSSCSERGQSVRGPLVFRNIIPRNRIRPTTALPTSSFPTAFGGRGGGGGLFG